MANEILSRGAEFVGKALGLSPEGVFKEIRNVLDLLNDSEDITALLESIKGTDIEKKLIQGLQESNPSKPKAVLKILDRSCNECGAGHKDGYTQVDENAYCMSCGNGLQCQTLYRLGKDGLELDNKFISKEPEPPTQEDRKGFTISSFVRYGDNMDVPVYADEKGLIRIEESVKWLVENCYPRQIDIGKGEDHHTTYLAKNVRVSSNNISDISFSSHPAKIGFGSLITPVIDLPFYDKWLDIDLKPSIIGDFISANKWSGNRITLNIIADKNPVVLDDKSKESRNGFIIYGNFQKLGDRSLIIAGGPNSLLIAATGSDIKVSSLTVGTLIIAPGASIVATEGSVDRIITVRPIRGVSPGIGSIKFRGDRETLMDYKDYKEHLVREMEAIFTGIPFEPDIDF